MSRKPWATSLDQFITKDFKIACIKNDVKMNDVLEKFMKLYSEGKIKIEIEGKDEKND